MQDLDIRKLEEIGCDALFLPKTLYHVPEKGDSDAALVVGGQAPECDPDSEHNLDAHCTWIEVENLSKGLCADSRPHFFRGVCTVVAKLFNIVEPDVAFFGKKDYQQYSVIKRMVRDLDFDINIVGVEIKRESDGLAMSR